jgi:hypothetical protein
VWHPYRGFGNVAFEYLAFVIDRTPEVDHLAIGLHVHLIEMPSPTVKPAHATHALAADVAGEQWAKSVPPMPHRLMANVYAALEQQVLDVPQRQREPHLHHHHNAEYLG